MSRQEFSIPVMFDVTADSREEAGKALVDILAALHLPGRTIYTDTGHHWTPSVVESWWTIEAEDKHHDRNDNQAGQVIFGLDL